MNAGIKVFLLLFFQKKKILASFLCPSPTQEFTKILLIFLKMKQKNFSVILVDETWRVPA